MTPQERQLVDDLFDRLSKVEGAPRDPAATEAISQGQRRAPNALYALVQTVLLQDEALKRANTRIQELEGGGHEAAQPPGGFLDTMRDALFGQNQSRGSVPNVPAHGARPTWNGGQVVGQQSAQPGYGQAGYGQGQYGGQPQFGQPAPAGGGGSFLGTAAAAAAGMVGGSLLLGSIRSMMGGSHQSFGDGLSGGGGDSPSPWSSDSSGGDLARDAGVNDIGSSGHRAGSFDQAQAEPDQDQYQDDGDYGGDDGDSDTGSDDSNFA